MTNKEARDYFQEEMIDGKCSDDCIPCNAMVKAYYALDKQIPKKPLIEERYYGNGKCPNCNAVFIDKSTKFCGNCGQALDWSD